jgi:RNA polymerase sigma factor (sigma-70 family)
MIREFRRRGQEDAVNQLLPKLLARSGRIVLKATAPGYVPDVEDLKQEVLGRLAELFAEDGGQAQSSVLDFYEVSFGQAFRTLRVEISAKEHARTERLEDLPELDDRGEEISETEALDGKTSKSRDSSSMEDPILRLDLARALAQLPNTEREAIVLHHHLGYEIESEDPTKRTVATICGVTGRTVRSRLRDAKTKLETLMEKNK